MFPFVLACCSLGGGGGLSSFVAPDLQGRGPPQLEGGVCCFQALFTMAERQGGALHNYQTVHYSPGSCTVQKYYS